MYPSEPFNSGIDIARGAVPTSRVTRLQYTKMWSSLIAINPSLYEYLQNFEAVNKTNALDNGQLTGYNPVDHARIAFTTPGRKKRLRLLLNVPPVTD
ncbi:hypothetical protein Zmor_025214 [Zophobas morio]|uniref:Uncharacterized protein n=1 Tax=Zophobas morio TaxID=2755281 RepID=A0AA38HR40_9CUCU|nr:hypothetical protein Zmor_025214 [Zophobas morio]